MPLAGSGTIAAATTLGTIADVTVSTAPAAGTVTANTDGSVTYQAGAAAPGNYPFQVTYTDEFGQTTTAGYTATVVGPPIPPATTTAQVPAAGSANFAAATTLGTIADVTVSNAPAGGTVTANTDGSVTYRAGSAAPGTYTFEVTYTDHVGQSTTAPFTVTVIGPPVPPTTRTAQVPLTGSAVFAAATTLGTVTGVTVSTAPAAGAVTVNPDGSLTYRAGLATPGKYSFQVTYTDHLGQSTTAGYTVTVIGPPVAPARTTTTIPITRSADFGPATSAGTITDVTVSTAPTGGTATVNLDGSLTYQADGTPGVYPFQVTYTDHLGQTTRTWYTVTTVAAPVPPEETTAQIPVAGTADFGPAASAGTITGVVVTDAPAAGAVVVHPDGSLTYQAGTAEPGTYSFQVTYTDHLAQTTQTYTVAVIAPPAAPAVQTAHVPEAGAATFAAATSLGTIADVAVTRAPKSGSVVVHPDGSLTYHAGTAQPGTYSFRVTYTDRLGQTTTTTYTVTVVGPPVPPAGRTAEVPQHGSADFAAATSLDTIAHVAVTRTPAAGRVTVHADGSLTYHALDAAPGTYSFQVTYTDGVGQTTTTGYTVTVVGPPVPPADESATVPPEGTTEFPAATSSGTITDVKVTEPSEAGSVTVNSDGSVTYHADDADPGRYSFQVTYTDRLGQIATATYRITVAEPQEWITAPWAPRGTSPATPPLPGTTRPDAVGPTTAPHGLTNNAPTTLGTTPHEHSPIGWWWWPAGTAMAFLAAGWFFLLALARRRRREDDEDTNQA